MDTPGSVFVIGCGTGTFKLVFFKTDHLGTPRMVTDHDGTILTTHDFLAYGEALSEPGETGDVHHISMPRQPR